MLSTMRETLVVFAGEICALQARAVHGLHVQRLWHKSYFSPLFSPYRGAYFFRYPQLHFIIGMPQTQISTTPGLCSKRPTHGASKVDLRHASMSMPACYEHGEIERDLAGFKLRGPPNRCEMSVGLVLGHLYRRPTGCMSARDTSGACGNLLRIVTISS